MPLGRSITILSRTGPISLESCRLAPVMTTESGAPRPSVRTCRLVPFFSPVGGVFSHPVPSQRSLDHRSVNIYPLPVDPFQGIVLQESGFPERPKHSFPGPFQKVPVQGARTAKEFCGNGFPLNSGTENIENTGEYLTRGQRLFSATRLSFIPFIRVPLGLGDERFNFLPQSIREFP
jgi:hypothetical protein